MPSPFDQSTYQVRLDWGSAGLARLAPADVVVVVDVLHLSSTVADAVAGGADVDLAQALVWSGNDAAVGAAAEGVAAGEGAEGPVVLLGALRNATAVARAVQVLQERRGARTSVAVIAAGAQDAGTPRFAIEDQLGAGAIVAALTDLGIDHTAPDAAVAAEGFRALRGALRHLLAAAGSGREIGAVSDPGGAPDSGEDAGPPPTSVSDAAVLDALDAVPVLRDGRFVRFE